MSSAAGEAKSLEETKYDLALAYRILANEGVLDTFGHVSVRHPERPDRYFLSRSRAPELVEPDDLIEYDLESVPVSPSNMEPYSERVIHGEIFKARPDVMAVCHHHADAFMPLIVTKTDYVPVVHLGSVGGQNPPWWDQRANFGDTNYLVVNSEEGGSLAEALGDGTARLERYPLADLRVGHTVTYDIEANWKVIVENYNECYHCGPVHPELCQIVPAFKQGGGTGLDWDDGVPHRDGANTFTASGTTTRAPFPGLSDTEKTHHKGELFYPNLMLSLSMDHVAAFYLWPQSAGHTRIQCDFLFHPDELSKPDFDGLDAIEFWDVVNQQDWDICESVQRGMRNKVFEHGYYAPMEDYSLDIRRYVRAKLDEADS